MYATSRAAVSSFATGLALYAFILRHQLFGPDMTILANPEFWVAVGFATVIGIFIYVGVPGIVARALDARAAAISAELNEAQRLRAEAANLLAGYRAKAASAEREAEAIIAEAKTDAERFSAEARTHLRNQLERRMQMAQEKIAQAEAQAMADIRAAAADAAAAAAQKLIAERLSDTRATALVDASIKELPGKLN